MTSGTAAHAVIDFIQAQFLFETAKACITVYNQVILELPLHPFVEAVSANLAI